MEITRNETEENNEEQTVPPSATSESNIKEIATINSRTTPTTVVNNISRREDPTETAWRKSFIRASLNTGTRISQVEVPSIIKILKEALNHVEEDGQIPPPYIDHI
jgi:predicted RND superfamily exporter protein